MSYMRNAKGRRDARIGFSAINNAERSLLTGQAIIKSRLDLFFCRPNMGGPCSLVDFPRQRTVYPAAKYGISKFRIVSVHALILD